MSEEVDWSDLKSRSKQLLTDHQSLIDEISVLQDRIRVLQTRNTALLGTIEAQGLKLAQINDVCQRLHITRTDPLIEILERK